MITSDEQLFVGQNLMSFCASKQSVLVKIDQALSVFVICKSNVTKKEDKVDKKSGYFYFENENFENYEITVYFFLNFILNLIFKFNFLNRTNKAKISN
jgi:hypothetical protein